MAPSDGGLFSSPLLVIVSQYSRPEGTYVSLEAKF